MQIFVGDIYQIEKILFYCYFAKSFYHEWCIIFPNLFSFAMTKGIFLYFGNMINYIDL